MSVLFAIERTYVCILLKFLQMEICYISALQGVQVLPTDS